MPQQKNNIEILVVQHKPAFVPKNKLLKPIQVGAATATHKLSDVAYYDNSGVNISDKNASYCELTAIFWAWKNLKADYYGLWHYRRYFSFSDEQDKNSQASRAYPNIYSATSSLGLDENNMEKTISQYDLIIPRQESIHSYCDLDSIYDQYRENHYIKDLDDCLLYIEQNYPEIAKFNHVLQSDKGYFCNMFIMRKDIFNDYCAFIFDILEKFDNNHEMSEYNVQQFRVDGYLAERLTNIYIHYLQSLKKYKIKEIQTVFFENTDYRPTVEPIDGDDNVTIALAANNSYAPYISTLIHSIVMNSSASRKYDINIFSQDFSSTNIQILQQEFEGNENISIRVCDMRAYADQYDNLFEKWQISVETYFRLFIPDIMAKYEKVLYLDGDMVVKCDVARIFDQDMDKQLLAAVRDIDMMGVLNSNSIKSDDIVDPKRSSYIHDKLKISNPREYFQAGVLLFNLGEIRKTIKTTDLIEFASRNWEFQDQDVLNYFAQGRVKFLNPKWNVQYDWEYWRIEHVISKAPRQEYLRYMNSRKDPYIIHFSGSVKPWQRANCDFAVDFWEVARRSAFYEQILSEMYSWISRQSQEDKGKQRRSFSYIRKFVNIIAPPGSSRRKPLAVVKRVIKRVDSTR